MALKDYIVQEIALDCEEGLLSRREALRRLGLLGVGATAAGVLLAACGDDSNTASATSAASWIAPATSSGCFFRHVRIAVDSRRVDSAAAVSATGEEIRFAGPNGELIGLVAEASSPRGAVLVIHENRGLTPHIRSIPRASPRTDTPRWPSICSPKRVGLRACRRKATRLRLSENAGGTDDRRPPCRARRARVAAHRMPSCATIGFCFGGGMT